MFAWMSESAMPVCPSCAAPVGEASQFCASCGTNLDLLDSPTGTAPRPNSPSGRGSRRGTATATPTSASGFASGGRSDRFAPGAVLGERYRILGLLGRGGMGEVYRADDLKLEQPVALKFLPPGLEADTDRLERLFGEVRMARQVSHPAVCRVWDIGEADGQHFLSMEYVDGENLSSLLRRIGRLPADKALDIAQQVCAGLAAAHEKGVLHRDLKPANVMLDGQGKVRITDFGLAGLADALTDEDVRSGTPSFMSPEQLLGREVTVRSDIYSLGLLLYELFTGRRAFTGKKLSELTRQHRDERPIEPSAIVPGLDPAVEATILACLEKDPARRPPSALAVSAMLGGQDPLDAAIAAGITPSPELVAAAGETERLSRKAAGAALAVVLLTVLLAPVLWSSFSLVNAVPVEKSPEVLEDRARDLISRLGFEATPADSAVGLWADGEYFRHAQAAERPPHDWAHLRTGAPPVLRFWYRQSPRPLISLRAAGSVTWNMPPAQVSHMAGVAYDLRGHLVDFYAVPPQVDDRADAGLEADWSPLFAEARLEPMQLEPAVPSWTPPFFVDTRAAWTGNWPDRPELPIRVEAAAYRGRAVWFRIIQPWTRPERMEPFRGSPAERMARHGGFGLIFLLVAVGAVLARRNLVLGRGDRRGAFRLAASMVGIGLTVWALEAHHVAYVGGEAVLAARGAGAVVLVSVLLWLFYLALEPYVRRLRPATLVSWTRLLSGGVGDAVVGRDVLIGATWGALVCLFSALASRLPAWLGLPIEHPSHIMMLGSLLGLRDVTSRLLDFMMGGILLGLGALLLYLILRFVLRREVPTVLAFVVILTFVATTRAEPLWLGVTAGLIVMGSYTFVLLRFGLLAACTGPFFANCFNAFPYTTDIGQWYAGPTLTVLPLVALLAVLAFRTAVGGSGLRRYLSGEAASSRP